MRIVQANTYAVLLLYKQDTQEEARCGNVAFKGPVFYSYGRAIAHKYPDRKLLLVSDPTGWSQTTKMHINGVTGNAPPGWLLWHCVDIFDPASPKNQQYFDDWALHFAKKVMNALSNLGQCVKVADDVQTKHTEVTQRCGLRPPPDWRSPEFWAANGLKAERMLKKIALAALEG